MSELDPLTDAVQDEVNPIMRIGNSATELIDRCRELWGEDVKLGDVVIVAEILLEDDDSKIYTEVVSLSSEFRPYMTAALLNKAAENVERNAEEEREEC